MLSREALRRIKREAGTPYFSTLYDIDMWNEDFKTVENDLEVLEILKPMLRIRKGNNWERLVVIDGFFNTKEQKTKVKEWLERWQKKSF